MYESLRFQYQRKWLFSHSPLSQPETLAASLRLTNQFLRAQGCIFGLWLVVRWRALDPSITLDVGAWVVALSPRPPRAILP